MESRSDLARLVAERVGTGPVPLLVGIGGAVAVGKSTTAARLHSELTQAGVRTEVLCTDCFLLPNDVLAARGLSMRKGFPESFDAAAVTRCLDTLAGGAPFVAVPVYSHTTYDIVPGEQRDVPTAAVVIVEGVNVLWSPTIERLHLAVYLDAHESDVRRWFVTRFEQLCTDAPAESFYRVLSELPEAQRHAIAASAWDDINLVNLREHIGPSRARATHVLDKAGDHRLLRLTAITRPG